MQFNLNLKKLVIIVPFATISGAMAVVMHEHPAAAVIAIISNVLLAMPMVFGLIKQIGWSLSLRTLVVLSGFAYAIESCGVRYGVPYGEFFYSQQLGPLWLSGVPVILPLSWVPLVIGAVSLSRFYFANRSTFVVGCIAALILVGVDLLLDPVAAKLQYWTWIELGPVYGVPLSNFGGWLLSGFIGAQLVPAFTPKVELRGLLEISLLLALLMWGAASIVCGFYWTAVVGYILSAFVIYTHVRES